MSTTSKEPSKNALTEIVIKPLKLFGDSRGDVAFPTVAMLEMLEGPIQDLNLATIKPGCVRGNHVSTPLKIGSKTSKTR